MKAWKILLTLYLLFGVFSVSAGGLKAKKDLSQLEQNAAADKADLSRMEDDAMVERMVKNGFFVPLPEVSGVRIDPELEEKCRYVRPWTAKFIRNTATLFHKKFARRSYQVNSAVRTAEYQLELQKKNGNAAPAYGPRRSSHLTGATIDITKKGMTEKEVRWFRKYLGKLKKERVILVVEEMKQSVFHIMVLPEYALVKPDHS